MLVQYTTWLFAPGGGFLVDYPVRVRLRASNVDAVLFSDSSGMSAENPARTGPEGLLSFFAVPGDYVAVVGGESYPIPLDASVTVPVIPGLIVHQQTEAATSWTIDHRFGVAPLITVVVNGDQAVPQIKHDSQDKATLTFGSPVTGTAYIRR